MTTAGLRAWLMTLVPGIHVAEDELDYEPSRSLSVALSGGMPTQKERTYDVLRVAIQARDITPPQSDALMAQVEYRILSGEDALIRHKPSRPGKGGSGGGKPERLPRLGPRVRAELYGHGLLQPFTTVS